MARGPASTARRVEGRLRRGARDGHGPDDRTERQPGGHLVYRYETTPAEAISGPLERLDIAYADFAFVDLGCGKGKPLLIAARYPFRRLIGVDVSPVCIDVARRNVAIYGPDNIDSDRIELMTIDVQDFAFPDSPMVIYMFNPFPKKVLRRVLANLEASLAQSPRPAALIYVNPEDLDVVIACKTFVRVPTTADWCPQHQWSAVFATRPADWMWPAPPAS